MYVGVRPALPVKGIDMILGNNLTGSRVWKTVSPCPVVSESLSASEQPDKSAQQFPDVFPVCAVTRLMSHARSNDVDGKGDILFLICYLFCLCPCLTVNC